MVTRLIFNDPMLRCCDPPGASVLPYLCCWLGVAIVHHKIRSVIDEEGTKGCLLTCCFCCIGAAINRKVLRDHYNIRGSCLIDGCVYIFCSCCMVTQEYRKMKRETDREPINAEI